MYTLYNPLDLISLSVHLYYVSYKKQKHGTNMAHIVKLGWDK